MALGHPLLTARRAHQEPYCNCCLGKIFYKGVPSHPLDLAFAGHLFGPSLRPSLVGSLRTPLEVTFGYPLAATRPAPIPPEDPCPRAFRNLAPDIAPGRGIGNDVGGRSLKGSLPHWSSSHAHASRHSRGCRGRRPCPAGHRARPRHAADRPAHEGRRSQDFDRLPGQQGDRFFGRQRGRRHGSARSTRSSLDPTARRRLSSSRSAASSVWATSSLRCPTSR